MTSRMWLQPLGRFPGLRVLGWHDGYLYAGRGYRLVRWHGARAEWQTVASFDAPPWRRVAARYRLSTRLFRDGYHALAVAADQSLIVILPKAIGRVPPGQSRVETRFRVPRGTRPLAVAATPAGGVFWGEYFDNPHREAVHLYGSTDCGRSWVTVYTFSPGEIRHVHSVTYDPYAGCLWVLTGDENRECRILRAALDWSSVDVVLTGSQQGRAVTLVPCPEALYFATDTPDEPNFIYRLERSGRLERVAPIASSSFWSCRVGPTIFFSTAVEPSAVNRDPHATLYAGVDGDGWKICLRWPGDRWPSRFFQYPNIVLPGGDRARRPRRGRRHASVEGARRVTS